MGQEVTCPTELASPKGGRQGTALEEGLVTSRGTPAVCGKDGRTVCPAAGLLALSGCQTEAGGRRRTKASCESHTGAATDPKAAGSARCGPSYVSAGTRGTASDLGGRRRATGGAQTTARIAKTRAGRAPASAFISSSRRCAA